jgi:hypothetical protein
MDSSPCWLVRERLDVTSYAVASFLARYRGMTLRAYKQDMRAFLRWCADRQLVLPLEAERPLMPLSELPQGCLAGLRRLS